MSKSYETLCRIIGNEPLPLAVIDLDALDWNFARIMRTLRSHRKRLRIASKSIRCPRLLRYIANKGKEGISGLMSYAVTEAAYLAKKGFKDILVAYPSSQKSDMDILARINTEETIVSQVIDSERHIQLLEETANRENVKIPVVIEVDLSYRPFGESLHIGVRRSPLHTAQDTLALVDRVLASKHLAMHGIMGYEAQIAGLTDMSSLSKIPNPAKRLIKILSRKQVSETREQIYEGLALRGLENCLINGGGTGSMEWSSDEKTITEVTVGSGFMGNHLLDCYRDVHVKPAAFFALQVVRKPSQKIVTCHGGGYVASGEAGLDRLPLPILPEGLRYLHFEGVGEVQTPLQVPKGVLLGIGDPVFFRHAKAGELAEHFNEYLLIRGDRIEARAKTYRGLGQCFLG